MPDLQRLNRNSLIIYFGENIDCQLLPVIAGFRQQLLAALGHLVLDTVPAYISLLVVFDDKKIRYSHLKRSIEELLEEGAYLDENFSLGKNYEIPVLYSADVAPDLLRLSQQRNLSVEELIGLHCAKPYTVYAVGFSPGFAYLGEVDQRIAAPRLASPRTAVPAGSVGIAESQTGVYPSQLPGGWNIIGRSPLDMFDTQLVEFPIKIGDSVTFQRVSAEHFQRLLGKSLLDYQK